MFPVRMFCNPMFAPRMFPKVGSDELPFYGREVAIVANVEGRVLVATVPLRGLIANVATYHLTAEWDEDWEDD